MEPDVQEQLKPLWGCEKPRQVLPWTCGCIQDVVLLEINSRFNFKIGIRSLETILNMIPNP